MTPDASEWVVSWPTLGFLAADWIEQHCSVPDGVDLGKPFELYPWQLWCTVNHYRVRDGAEPAFSKKKDGSRRSPAAGFHFRRSQVVGPQKVGKGPWSAAMTAFEGLGPAVFDGFADGGELYRCRDHGCGCGWQFEYVPGDPIGRHWPKPLIQVLATSEDQVDNIWRPLQTMIRNGPLADVAKVGEEFIRLPGDGRIDAVTSSANSRLGAPITFAVQDENGIYTKENKLLRAAQTMRRGVAGMGGRSLQTTNAPDPAENSDAQQTLESQREDIFKFYREPPKDLSYRNKRDRKKIHKHVYDGTPHVDLDAIEGEAAELLETDPAQAERFYGNRRVQGKGAWITGPLWDDQESLRDIPTSGPVVAGFDGSDSDDWTAIRLETLDGFQFTPTYGPDDRPTIWSPQEWGGRIPRAEVHAAWESIFDRFTVVRAYCDRRGWATEVDDAWPSRWGDDVVLPWETYRVKQMHDALTRFLDDLRAGSLTHDSCQITATHVANARKVAAAGDRYVLAKPSQHQKIDVAMASALAHEAACDARAAGLTGEETAEYAYVV